MTNYGCTLYIIKDGKEMLEMSPKRWTIGHTRWKTNNFYNSLHVSSMKWELEKGFVSVRTDLLPIWKKNFAKM